MTSDNNQKHIFMDDELRTNLKREFDRLAVDGAIGDPNGEESDAYIRVSSSGQAEEGRSGLPRQLEHIAEKARQEGLKIPWERLYCDDHSGFEFENRRGLNALLQATEMRSNPTKLVIEYPDRMSRQHTWHYGYIREQFQKRGAEFVYWQGYHSEIERSVVGAVSEQGMKDALARMQYGTLEKARSGRITAKSPAYGYKLVDGKGRDRTDPQSQWRGDTHYAIVEDEAEVVRLVYHRLAYEGDTLLQIANDFNEMQVAPPKNSSHWEQTLLSYIVKNPTYKGEYTCHRWVHKKVWSERSQRMVTKKMQRPRDAWIIVPVPAIVSPETWELAQKMLKRNRSLCTRNAHYDFLLLHLLVCDECKRAYTAYTKTVKKKDKVRLSVCYRCVGKNYQVKVVRERLNCTQSQISARVLDPVVWQVMVNVLTEPEMLTKAMEEYYAQLGLGQIKSQIAFLEEQICQRQREDEKLYQAYQKGVYSIEELGEFRKVIIDALSVLETEKNKLATQLISEQEFEERKKMVCDLSKTVRSQLGFADVPFEIKRRVVRLLVKQIVLNVNEGWFKIDGIIRGTFSIQDGTFVSTPVGRDSWPR